MTDEVKDDIVNETPDETPVPDPEKHIALEQGHQEFSLVPHPEGWQKDRRIFHDGQNFEHVWDTPEGVWVYRRM